MYIHLIVKYKSMTEEIDISSVYVYTLIVKYKSMTEEIDISKCMYILNTDLTLKKF
jgi:hypothetical protein